MAEQTIVLTGGVTKNAPDNPVIMAKSLFKSAVNVGEAIVSVLGNTGIAGFKFHCPQSEQVNLESEITDHYIDTGSAVQDHIARRPVTIMVNGYQGEYYYTVHPVESMLAKVTPTLSLVKQFIPKLSDSTKQKLAKKYQQLTNSATTPAALQTTGIKEELNGIDLFKLFQEVYKITSAQTRAYMFFEALWKANALFTVETGWKRYDNLIIQKIMPKRENADITDFSITFKQISITTSKVESVKNAAGRLKEQKAEVTQKGIDKGQEVGVGDV